MNYSNALNKPWFYLDEHGQVISLGNNKLSNTEIVEALNDSIEKAVRSANYIKGKVDPKGSSFDSFLKEEGIEEIVGAKVEIKELKIALRKIAKYEERETKATPIIRTHKRLLNFVNNVSNRKILYLKQIAVEALKNDSCQQTVDSEKEVK